MRAFLILGIALALSASAFAQQMYRWVDKDGRVHYTQTPPPAGAKNVQKKPLSAGAGDAIQLPYATRIAAANFPVALYVSDECTDPCKEARGLLAKRGIPHRVIEVADAKSLEDLKRVSGGISVPVLSVGREVLKGFDATQYHAALDSAGYPASGPQVPPQVLRNKPEAEAAPEQKQSSVPASIPAGQQVTLYASPECGAPCKDARELLAARGVEFREVQVVLPKDIDELQRISGGNQVPVLTIGTFVMRGFAQSDYQAALDAAGYKTPAAAKSSPAPRAAAKR
ncbi:MAG: glutaredoxin family protein [Betaproteobacteria bacterium]|nr:glutaredoxin family protein [Betaproteobacteria bacterium]